MEKFKEETTFEQRVLQSRKLIFKYRDRIPIIVKPGNKITPDVEKCKYLVPNNLTIGEFVSIIRKRINLDSKKAMFIFVGTGILPPTASTIQTVYEEHRDEDGFLYVTYSLENTFG